MEKIYCQFDYEDCLPIIDALNKLLKQEKLSKNLISVKKVLLQIEEKYIIKKQILDQPKTKIFIKHDGYEIHCFNNKNVLIKRRFKKIGIDYFFIRLENPKNPTELIPITRNHWDIIKSFDKRLDKDQYEYIEITK